MLDLPATAILGMSGSGALNGVFPVSCTRCKKGLVLLTWHPLTHYAIQSGIFLRFATVIGVPGAILADNDAMTLLTPDNRPGATYAYWDGWTFLLSLHTCHIDSPSRP